MSRHEPIIEVEEWEEAREESDDDVWSDYDVFFEARDRYDLKELALTAVEGQFTHPSGHHSPMTLQDVVVSISEEFVDDVVPDELPEEVHNKFGMKVRDNLADHAEELYNEVKDRADEIVEDEEKSIGDLQEYLEDEADNLGIPTGV